MPTRAFARAWDRLVDRFDEGVRTFVVDTGDEFIRRVVPHTPRDTGRAQNNWRARINISPPDNQIERFDPAVQVVERGARVIRQYRVGDVIRIKNSANYIGDLNAGRSPQAEAGYIQRDLVSAQAAVRAKRARSIFGLATGILRRPQLFVRVG